MNRRPLLLDLFCGGGGAAVGYHHAGFDVVGVDNRPQPRYPFAFIQADALAFLDSSLVSTFDAIHASPPCQRYSSGSRWAGTSDTHPDLVAPVRELLQRSRKPWVIENVVGAPLIAPVTLCGASVANRIPGFKLKRHRLFESSFVIMAPPCTCRRDGDRVLGVYGGGTSQKSRPGGGRNTDKANLAQARELLELPHMTRAELTQAIPAAYTELIGWQLRAQLPVAN